MSPQMFSLSPKTYSDGENLRVKRKIAIFTGNRAEYGQQYPVIKAIAANPRLEYFLLVSGAHLEEDFGRTEREIEADGFRVHREVQLTMVQDTLYATAQAIGTGILSLSRILDELRPDMLLMCADRFEGFAAAIAGTQMGIPTAHIEGGDITEGGALDDSVRHAITKLAHLHFTTNPEASRRVIALGEEPWRVHTVGLPMLDLVAEGIFAPASEVLACYELDPTRPIVCFTQHSVATEFEMAADQVRPSVQALENLARDGYQIIITYPNNDAGGRRIISVLEELRDRHVPGIRIYKSVGRYFYHGLLNICGRIGRGACVGNSSSGIKETPAFGCPVVNIGARQKGRLRADNVIDVPYDAAKIEAVIRHCIEDESWRAHCGKCENPYGKGDAGLRISEVFSTVELNLSLIQKRMML